MKVLTFLTDFGLKSNYVAQMKAVVLNIVDANIIDISHNIAPQNITEGAFLLKTTVPFFPNGSVHVAVVDPGVGTQRRGIVIATKTQILIGPDNGLLIPAARHLGDFEVYEIKNKNLMMNEVSNTFHGRDIFAPVAAHILKGVYFNEIGPRITDYNDLNIQESKFTEKTIEGKIISIDSFGNIITNINGLKLKKVLEYNKNVIAYIGKTQIKLPFLKTYGEAKKDQVLASIGSSNLLEISINLGNAAEKYKIKNGEDIKILYG